MRQTERVDRVRAVAVAQTAGDHGSAYAVLFALTGMSLIAAGHAWPAIIELLRQVCPG